MLKSRGGPINLTLVSISSAIGTKLFLFLYLQLLPPERGSRDLIPLATTRTAYLEHLLANQSSCDHLATREVCVRQQDGVPCTLCCPLPGSLAPRSNDPQVKAKVASPTLVSLDFKYLSFSGPPPLTCYRGISGCPSHKSLGQATQCMCIKALQCWLARRKF